MNRGERRLWTKRINIWGEPLVLLSQAGWIKDDKSAKMFAPQEDSHSKGTDCLCCALFKMCLGFIRSATWTLQMEIHRYCFWSRDIREGSAPVGSHWQKRISHVSVKSTFMGSFQNEVSLHVVCWWATGKKRDICTLTCEVLSVAAHQCQACKLTSF